MIERFPFGHPGSMAWSGGGFISTCPMNITRSPSDSILFYTCLMGIMFFMMKMLPTAKAGDGAVFAEKRQKADGGLRWNRAARLIMAD